MRVVGGLLLLASCWAFGQATVARPEFEVADIKPNKSGDENGSGTILPSGQFRAVNIPIKELIKFAYNVRDENIIGAPGWIDSERYDVIGKAAPVGVEEVFWRSTNVVQVMHISYNWDETFRQMAQTLLADRFKLAVHQEERPLNVYALVIAKGGKKLKEAADSGRPDCTRRVVPVIQAEAVCKNMTMANLAQALQVLAPGYANRNVLDLTGLKDSYDFTITWVGRAVSDQEGGLTIPDALEKQLGIKMEGRRMPVSVIIVDHIDRPSEN
jgi:uncharacterized protein (TIGR03435 family)